MSETTTNDADRRMTEEEPMTMEEYYEMKERERMAELREDGLLETGPELLGMPNFEDGEQLGCDECNEATPAEDWKPHGPTYRENGRRVKDVIGLVCPTCGSMD